MNHTDYPALPTDDAARALQRLRHLADSSRLEQSNAMRQLALTEGWLLWPLGGFQLNDGSVLQRCGSEWQRLDAVQARMQVETHIHGVLEVRILHTYEGQGGREKFSVSEARFECDPAAGCWRLKVEYEAYMDSPLFDFGADCARALLDLDLHNLLIDTTRPDQRWRLQQIALHPDWLELLCVSRRPEEVAMNTS